MDKATPLRAHRTGQAYTPEERKIKQELFLQALRKEANVTRACEIAQIDRNTIYDWRKKYKEFAALFLEADLIANDVIRAEIYRRGVTGYEKPVVSMGRVVYDANAHPLTEKVYSDTLLIMLAKSRMPEFREKQQIDLSAQVVNMADQAREELLTGLSAAMNHEKKSDSG